MGTREVQEDLTQTVARVEVLLRAAQRMGVGPAGRGAAPVRADDMQGREA